MTMSPTPFAVAATLALGLTLSTHDAHATDPDGLFMTTATIDHAEPGALPTATVPGASPRWVRLGAAITHPEDMLLASTTNANTQYLLRARYHHTTPCQGTAVRLNGVITTTDGGSSGDLCDAFFTIPAAMVPAAARLLHLTAHDRHPAGESITGAFVPARPVFTTHDNIEIVLRLTAPAHSSTVWGPPDGPPWMQGTGTPPCQLTRDGQPLHVTPPQGMMGGSWTAPPAVAITPAAPREFRYTLNTWYPDATRPGHYVAVCESAVSFARGTIAAIDLNAADWWDRQFRGTATFDVR